jgi:hypothetical protein
MSKRALSHPATGGAKQALTLFAHTHQNQSKDYDSVNQQSSHGNDKILEDSLRDPRKKLQISPRNCSHRFRDNWRRSPRTRSQLTRAPQRNNRKYVID